MSRFVKFSFFAGVSLATLQFLLVLSGGNSIAGLFWGIIPVWFWATYQKLKQEASVGQLEGIAAYTVVIYGGLLGLLALFCLFAAFAFLVIDPEVIQAAMEQQPNYDDFSDEELTAINQVMEWLPKLMPLITAAICIQATAYIGYGLAVVRNYSR